jgi:hypothetical protein
MEVRYCEVCDSYEEYDPSIDCLSCGHRADNDGGHDLNLYYEEPEVHVEEEEDYD